MAIPDEDEEILMRLTYLMTDFHQNEMMIVDTIGHILVVDTATTILYLIAG